MADIYGVLLRCQRCSVLLQTLFLHWHADLHGLAGGNPFEVYRNAELG